MSIRRMPLILAFALVGSPALAQTSIDDFAVAQAQLQAAPSCSGASCSFVAGAMLGAERDIRTQLFSGTGAATAEVTGGAFVFNGVGTAFAEARLVWDGTDSNADTTAFPGLAGVNLTTGADSIILDVNSASSGAVVIVEVFTDATSTSLYTLWLPAVAVPTSFALPFTAFTTHFGSGAAFTNVGAISLTVRGPGATLSLDAIRAGIGAAPAVGASKTVAISNDLGRAGSAEPGDTIKYTIQIDNKSGKPTSPNTALVDTLDANLTLVPGSAEASPIGIEDYYFQGGASATVLAPGVLGNDVDPDGDAKSVATTGSITTTQGATATVNADGSFSVAVPADGSLDTFTYEVTDGNGITSPAVVTVGLLPNVAPVLANGSSVAYTENGAPLAINTAITVNDADSPTLSTGTVSITANFVTAQDVLSFTNVPGTMGNVAGVYTPGTGVMALTSTGSTATLLQWQAALQAVKYSNTSDNPSTTSRTVSFVVNDGSANSNTVTSTVSVTSVNDAPVLTAGATLNYTENQAATVIDSTVTVADPDSATIASATVQITGSCTNPQDVLSFSTQNGIAGVYTAASCLMTLSGSSSVANYQTALRTVTYSNTSDNPTTSTRTITWRVNDGAGVNNLSNQPTSTISITAVNDAPVLAGVSGGFTYAENNAATAVAPGISISDLDNLTLTQGTVSISNNFQSGQDVLSFVNVAMGNIAISSNAGGVLTLSSAGGTATLAQWQAAMAAVKYANTSEDPNTSVRTVTFQVDDGAGANNLSNTPTRTITVTAVNDAPTATGFTNLPAQAGIPITYPTGKLSGTDAEAGTTITIDTTPINVTNGTATLNANGSFTFTPLPNATVGSFQYRVSDNGNPGPGVNSAYVTVSFTVAGPSIYFVKGSGVGLANCTLGNECSLGAAVAAIGAAGSRSIFIGDGGTYANNVPLNTNGNLIGQGLTGFTFDGFFGIGAPAQGTLATRPLLSQARPTISISTAGVNIVSMASGTTHNVLGLNITTGSATTTAIFANNFGTLTTGDVTIVGSGPALDLAGGTLSGGFTSISSSGGATGIRLVGVAGTSTVGGGALSGSSGDTLFSSTGTLTLSYGGTITQNTANQRVVNIQNKTGGTYTFNGAISSTGAGIRLNGNSAGMAINFAGSLALSTGANTAIDASSGAGTITATQNNTSIVNTLTTTTGIALNVSGITIGASGLTFRSISSNGGSKGIVLNNTGTSGGLTVTGTGTTAGSGGTIQNISSRGGEFINTKSLSLNNMNFTNANTADSGSNCGASNNSGCNAALHLDTVTGAVLTNVSINGAAQQGINLREVSGFQLVNSSVINGGAGGQTEEADLYAINMFGTCAITNSSLTVPAERAAVIYNTSKTLDLTVTGSTFGMNQTQPLGADGLEVSSYGASNTTLRVVNSTFVQPKTNGLQVITENTSVSSVDITGSTFDPGTGLAAAIDLDVNNTANMKFNISGNPSIKGKGINIVNVFAFPDATFEGRINNNVVTSNGGSGTGIRVVSQGNGNSKVEIKNNSVTGGDDYGIDVTAQLGSGRVDATITGNTVSVSNNGFYAIHTIAGASGSTFTNKMCANVASNTTTVPAGAIGNFQARAATGTHEVLLQGAGGNVAANWSANSNTPVPGVTSQSGTGVFTFGATCAVPSNPLP
ncbi:MAG: Ig-like domain-containing protein [Vicinamibacteria bacterium]